MKDVPVEVEVFDPVTKSTLRLVHQHEFARMRSDRDYWFDVANCDICDMCAIPSLYCEDHDRGNK